MGLYVSGKLWDLKISRSKTFYYLYYGISGFLELQYLTEKIYFSAEIFRAFYWHVDLSLGKVWRRNTDIQFIAVYNGTEKNLSKMMIPFERRPMGTYSLDASHTLLRSTLCTKVEVNSDLSVALVPSSEENRITILCNHEK